MDLEKVSVGEVPDKVTVFIEIPKGSNVKYELDKKTGFIKVDRFLYTAMSYPFNYGFIPNTMAEDGDPIDVLVLSEYPVVPGVVVTSKIIGLLEMKDEAGIDTKLIAVPTLKIDPHFGAYEDIQDVPKGLKDKIKHFFENYKTLEPGKWVEIKEWKGKKEATEVITKLLKS
jgi:inorganic pyrophosphatase